VSYEDDIAEGFAQLLAAETDPAQLLTWQASGVYPASVTGIYIYAVPATPDRIVTLSLYGLGDGAMYGDSETGLQVRCRSAGQDPRDATGLDSAIADVLLGRYPLDLPTGVHVQTLVRANGPTSLGPDDNQRWSFTSNYTLGLHRPGPHRL
jgi:hypothetical protein